MYTGKTTTGINYHEFDAEELIHPTDAVAIELELLPQPAFVGLVFQLGAISLPQFCPQFEFVVAMPEKRVVVAWSTSAMVKVSEVTDSEEKIRVEVNTISQRFNRTIVTSYGLKGVEDLIVFHSDEDHEQREFVAVMASHKPSVMK